MNAEIISVGTELLLGEILNTDAQFLATELSKIGVDVYYQTVVGDNRDRLKKALELALSRADVIITSGGLGPTPDDLTKEVIAECMGEELVMHKESLSAMEEYFRKINRQMVESNKKQAMMPEHGKVLVNHNGTAPGVIIEKNGKTVIMLPGPPNELQPMYRESVEPYLKSKSEYMFVSRVLHVVGIGESAVAEKLEKMMESYTNPTVAPYAKTAEVRLRITAKCKTEDEGMKLIEPVEQEIRKILGNHIYGINDDSIVSVVCGLIKKKGGSISAAESCTGGMFASMIVGVPGSSEILNESVVTYADSAKMKYLGVKEETLKQYGAVSEQTAREMAEGICKNTDSLVGVGITGIAGPDGGTEEKPVGLVYIGVCLDGKTSVTKLLLAGDRAKIREAACLHAFNAVRLELEK